MHLRFGSALSQFLLRMRATRVRYKTFWTSRIIENTNTSYKHTTAWSKFSLLVAPVVCVCVCASLRPATSVARILQRRIGISAQHSAKYSWPRSRYAVESRQRFIYSTRTHTPRIPVYNCRYMVEFFSWTVVIQPVDYRQAQSLMSEFIKPCSYLTNRRNFLDTSSRKSDRIHFWLSRLR